MQKSHLDEIRPEPKINLGGTVLKNNKQDQALSNCHFQVVSKNLEKRHNKLKYKVKTSRTMVIPCMIYGSETWNCGKNDCRKLDGL